MQLGPNHHIFKSDEGEAFKIKEESKEAAYLIYRTIKFLLLIVFMHKVSKKNQTASDKFYFFLNMPQSVYSQKERLKHENKRQLQRRKQKGN